MPNSKLEKRLWNTADKLRANSGLRTYEYSFPVFWLIFLRRELKRERFLRITNRF